MGKVIKIGAKVKVKSDLVGGNNYGGLLFNNNMEQYRGNEYIVVNRECDYINTYSLEGIANWIFNEEMLEVNEEDMIEEENIIHCDCCGREVENKEDLMYIEDTNEYVCESCRNNHYVECRDCGKIIHRNNAYRVGDDYVCESCRDSYIECYNCGNLVHEYDVRYDEHNDRYYCDDCYDDCHARGLIYNYHEFNDWKFYKGSEETDEEVPFYIGHELEVENCDNDYTCQQYLYDNLNVVLAHDGSIDDGYEIISHPQSYKYIVENKDRYKNALQKLIDCGYKSHNTNTCGLHFHVSRPYYNEIRNLKPWASEEDAKLREELLNKSNEIIDRIILVMETYKQELIKFSRRTSGDLSHWAQFLSDYRGKDKIDSLYYIKKNKTDSTRYMALNLTNNSTIEFRIFKGTLKYETFMASVELVNNIMTLCSDLSIPVEEITWSRLTETEFASAYCNERDIHTDKVVVDMSLEEIRKEQERERKLAVLDKKVIELYNEVMKYYTNIKLYKKYSISTNRDKLAENYRLFGKLESFTDNIRDFLGCIETKNMDNIVYWCNRVVNNSMGSSIDLNANDKIKELVEEFKELV